MKQGLAPIALVTFISGIAGAAVCFGWGGSSADALPVAALGFAAGAVVGGCFGLIARALVKQGLKAPTGVIVGLIGGVLGGAVVVATMLYYIVAHLR